MKFSELLPGDQFIFDPADGDVIYGLFQVFVRDGCTYYREILNPEGERRSYGPFIPDDSVVDLEVAKTE